MAGVQCTKSYYTSYIKFDFANGPKKHHTNHKSFYGLEVFDMVQSNCLTVSMLE